MRFYLSFVIILVTFFNCKKDNDLLGNNYAYIGGEIINPKTNYVVLFKDQTTLDTIKLNSINRFLYKVDSLKEGIYTFKHGPETQIVLLEPKDSVFFRLNTLEFDESLVFTGHGDKKNNYLIDRFLDHEKEEKHIIRLCQLDPNLYEKHIDSIRIKNENILERFINKYEPSPLFIKIAKGNIKYNYYSNKEVYPFAHRNKDKIENLKKLPHNFYDYRKNINYNDSFFNSYHNYRSFIKHNICNVALSIHAEHVKTEKSHVKHSFCYNLDRLKLVDSLITNPDVKNDLLYHFTLKYLSKSDNEEHNNIILKYYTDNSNDVSEKERMTKYANSIHRLKDGANLPSINLVNHNNEVVKLNDLIKKSTVITFWSNTYYDHFKESHYKIKELKVKYPEIDFISINIDDYSVEKSKQLLKNLHFDTSHEYRFQNTKVASEKLIIYPITKVIVVDKNKKIIDNNANIFSFRFEGELLGLINK